MINSLNLNDLKSKDYLILTKKLNKLLFEYWNLLKSSLIFNSIDNISFIYEIVNLLNLNDEIKTISFENQNNYIGGFYNNTTKKMSLSVDKIVQFEQLNIISQEAFIIEYLTILFHEIFHAIQYKYLINDKHYLISIMKQLSNYIKQNKNLNSKLHDLIPDEREASIESAKLIYDFYIVNNLSKNDCNESIENLNFYITNGYLYKKNITIFPYQSIKNYDNNIPLVLYDNLGIFNKLIYGLDIKCNPTLALFINESNTKLLKL